MPCADGNTATPGICCIGVLHGNFKLGSLLFCLAPQVGFEPTTLRLTAECSRCVIDGGIRSAPGAPRNTENLYPPHQLWRYRTAGSHLGRRNSFAPLPPSALGDADCPERKYRELWPPRFWIGKIQPNQLTHSPGERIGARRSPDPLRFTTGHSSSGNTEN